MSKKDKVNFFVAVNLKIRGLDGASKKEKERISDWLKNQAIYILKNDGEFSRIVEFRLWSKKEGKNGK